MGVTFIIPVQRFKPCLLETLNAVSDLKGIGKEEYEILVIQNGPKETIPTWVSSNEKVKCFYLMESSIPKARNLGLHESKHEFLCYLDEDSVCSPTWLEEALYFIRHKNVGAYQSPSWSNKNIVRFEEYYLQGDFSNGTILFDTGASCFKKEGLLAINGFDESFKRVEDLDLAMRLANNGWMISYGTLVTGGTDRPSYFNRLRNFIQSAFHSKRLFLKHNILGSMSVFPKNVKLSAKRPPLRTILERALFYVFNPKVSHSSTQIRSRYVFIFMDKIGKSFLIKSRFYVLITTKAVIIIIDRFRVISTEDQYVYSTVLNSQTKVELEMEMILDKLFVDRISESLI